MNVTRELLEQWTTAYQQMGVGSPFRGEAFILRNADVDAKGIRLPKRFKRGERKQCFSNAAKLAIEYPLEYCEGYAAEENILFPFLHAWCLDRNGRVIDPTLERPDRYHYLGIKVPRQMLMAELARNEVYGLLDAGGGYNKDFMERFEKEVRKCS